MKIIHLVLGKANPDRMNGVNKVAHQLAAHQYRLGCDVAMWGITANTVHDYPLRDYPTQLFAPGGSAFSLTKEIKAAIIALEPDTVFHIHGGFIPTFYAVANALHQCGIPFVYTPHGAYNKAAINRSWLKKNTYFLLFERSIIKWSKAIHLLGKSEMEALSTRLATSKKIMIPNGQNWQQVAPAIPSVRTCPRFVFCGRLLTREKGLDLMLEGFAAFLQATNAKSELWILGDGPDRSALQAKQEALGLTKAVTFFGSRYGEEKDMMLRQCDAHVLFSRNEGMPMAVLEAAAMRLPSIVSPETNMGGFIKQYQAGIALRENTPAAIAAAFEACTVAMHNGEWSEYGINALTMIQESFDWEQIAMRLCQVYTA